MPRTPRRPGTGAARLRAVQAGSARAEVRTKSIYKPREDGDGVRVLVTRFYPRGVKKTHFDRWVRDLAPSAQLLKKYKSNGVTWGQFSRAFRRELRDGCGAARIRDLHAESRRLTVTLLCYEPEGANCHRHLLKDMIADPSALAGPLRGRRRPRAGR